MLSLYLILPRQLLFNRRNLPIRKWRDVSTRESTPARVTSCMSRPGNPSGTWPLEVMVPLNQLKEPTRRASLRNLWRLNFAPHRIILNPDMDAGCSGSFRGNVDSGGNVAKEKCILRDKKLQLSHTRLNKKVRRNACCTFEDSVVLMSIHLSASRRTKLSEQQWKPNTLQFETIVLYLQPLWQVCEHVILF